jgi:hypothetical protein
VSLRSLCRQTCTIYTRATTAASGSNAGGHVRTNNPLYSSIPCALQPRRGDTSTDNGRRAINTAYVAYTPVDVSGITTGATLVSDGVTYLIDSWGNMAGRDAGWKIDLTRKS